MRTLIPKNVRPSVHTNIRPIIRAMLYTCVYSFVRNPCVQLVKYAIYKSKLIMYNNKTTLLGACGIDTVAIRSAACVSFGLS